MTFTQIIKDIFTKSKKINLDNSSQGGTKRFLSKISGAFMLPISVMAIAGLFLGVGNAIESQTSSHVLGQFIKNLGDPIFGAMPVLFMIAIVISFTDDVGVAVFAGVVAFLVFMAIQSPFIQITKGVHHNSARILYPMSSDLEQKLFSLQGTVLGIKTLNTSIFGGIIVGMIMSWTYNKFHEVELPSSIAFFGGKRFVAFAGIVLMIPLSFTFLLIWPWIGIGLAYFGEYSGKIHGLGSFVFGYTERALVPFGLHHVFYAPLWWTGAGGDATIALNNFQTSHIGQTGWLTYNGLTDKAAVIQLLHDLKGQSSHPLQGDSYIWLAVSGLPVSTINGKEAFVFFDQDLGLDLGRFMQGKFSFMQMGLPAAGAAMVMAAPKETRKNAINIILPASLTSFLTGVTEPIEFTFLFLAPALFWGFHAIMCAFSFLFMTLLGAHTGMTFSGGFIDTIIYGILPMAKGTHFWWIYVIGSILAPIYFVVFYWAIRKFDLATPGRGGTTKLFKKEDYRNKNNNLNKKVGQQTLDIIEAFGGENNIVKTANCATRLRFDVKNSDLVSEDKLKKSGAFGVMKVSKTHVQGIFGPKAEVINTKINKYLSKIKKNY